MGHTGIITGKISSVIRCQKMPNLICGRESLKNGGGFSLFAYKNWKDPKEQIFGFFLFVFFDSGDAKLVWTLSSSRHDLVIIRSREIPKLVTEITSKVLTRLCCRLRVMRQVFHLSEILVDRQFVVSDLLMRYVYTALLLGYWVFSTNYSALYMYSSNLRMIEERNFDTKFSWFTRKIVHNPKLLLEMRLEKRKLYFKIQSFLYWNELENELLKTTYS